MGRLAVRAPVTAEAQHPICRPRFAVKEGMNKREVTVSAVAANLLALITGLLPALHLPGLFALVWGSEQLRQGLDGLFGFGNGQMTALILLFLPGIVVHELLHALGWICFGRADPSAIQFGGIWKALTPYAHCKVPLPAGAYRAGTFLPGLLMGIVPGLLGVLFGNFFLVAVGFLFTFTAGGDYLVLWLLRAVSPQTLVEDHPSKMGAYVFELGPETAEDDAEAS